jgi:hypothetical protein
MIAIFGITVWIVFSIRDYLLLETFGGRGNRAALAWYLATTLLITDVITAVWLTKPRLVDAILTPRFLLIALGAHAALSVWPILLARSGWLSAARVVALLPAPAAWILLMLGSMSIAGGNSRAAAMTAAWLAITSALTVAGAGSRLAAPEAFADDRGFPVRFAACSNCLALCLIPMIGW